MIIQPSLIKNFKRIDSEIEIDLTKYKHPEVIDIKDVYANGIIKWEEDNLFINLNIDANLTLASTKTLEPIDYNLKFPLELIFGEHKEADFVLEKKIDLSGIIFGHIILEKPQSIYHEDEEIYVDETKKVNPFFEDLKDFEL